MRNDSAWRVILLGMMCVIVYTGARAFGQEQMASEATAPKIIPTPKKIVLRDGGFNLNEDTYILFAKPERKSDRFAAWLLQLEIRDRLKFEVPAMESSRTYGNQIVLGVAGDPLANLAAQMHGVNPEDVTTPEGYVIDVSKNSILLLGSDEAGAFHAVQTLKQIIRTARPGAAIPLMRIDDWPDFHFRGITDDISRGPIPRMDTIKTNIARLAEFKLNKFNFYIEHVFCFKKHPDIGPEGGCLTADDLREIDEYAKQYHVELVGGLQSFGHMLNILKHSKYNALAENPLVPWSISPARNESYDLMRDMYSEVATAVSSPLFNISCDETYDLGQGQSRALADKIGPAALYAGHINKLNDILTDYNKRIMMWADIALKHPDILNQLPRNLIFLPWEYGPRDNFDDMLTPIKATGHDFIVSPGVNCWGRMFPNLNNAIPNIAHFSRDGAKYGALGVLNTTWDDDGENLFGYNWYPIVWGAETSWNPNTADISSFDGKFSQGFYGTADDSAAEAMLRFKETGMTLDFSNLDDSRYWQWPPASMFPSYATAEADAKRLLSIARKAEAFLLEAKKSATANVENLDYPLFAAHRLQDLARRRIVFYRCARAYDKALTLQATDAKAAVEILKDIQTKLLETENGILEIWKEYGGLWMRENRPYWLDNNKKKYDDLVSRIATMRNAVGLEQSALSKGGPLAPSDKIGFELPKTKVQ